MSKSLQLDDSQNEVISSVNLSTSAHFNLFLKTHEIQQMNALLTKIAKMPRKLRQDWILEHGDYMHKAFDNLVDESNLLLDSLSLDEKTLELSQELVVSLRDAMDLVDSILYSRS